MREGGVGKSTESWKQTLTEDRSPVWALIVSRFHANAEFIGIQSSSLPFLFCPPAPSSVSKIEINYEQQLRNRTILGSHHHPPQKVVGSADLLALPGLLLAEGRDKGW